MAKETERALTFPQCGARIHRLRVEQNMQQCELAQAAGISPAHLSALEHGQVKSPGAAILYAVADVLGTTVAELLGQAYTVQTEPDLPPSLVDFARMYDVPHEDVEMLARISLQGRQPKRPRDWWYIYRSIQFACSGG